MTFCIHWKNKETGNFDSELGPLVAGTQYIKTNTVKAPSVGINVSFEEMHTQKSECQVGVANNIIKYIEAGDTNMGIVQAHPSTCVRNKKHT